MLNLLKKMCKGNFAVFLKLYIVTIMYRRKLYNVSQFISCEKLCKEEDDAMFLNIYFVYYFEHFSLYGWICLVILLIRINLNSWDA